MVEAKKPTGRVDRRAPLTLPSGALTPEGVFATYDTTNIGARYEPGRFTPPKTSPSGKPR